MANHALITRRTLAATLAAAIPAAAVAGQVDIEESHPSQSGPFGACQAAWQREPSLQDDGLLARQLLPLQGALRHRRRARPSGAHPPQAPAGQPHGARDRGGHPRALAGAARLRPDPGRQQYAKTGALISPAIVRGIPARATASADPDGPGKRHRDTNSRGPDPPGPAARGKTLSNEEWAGSPVRRRPRSQACSPRRCSACATARLGFHFQEFFDEGPDAGAHPASNGSNQSAPRKSSVSAAPPTCDVVSVVMA